MLAYKEPTWVKLLIGYSLSLGVQGYALTILQTYYDVLMMTPMWVGIWLFSNLVVLIIGYGFKSLFPTDVLLIIAYWVVAVDGLVLGIGLLINDSVEYVNILLSVDADEAANTTLLALDEYVKDLLILIGLSALLHNLVKSWNFE